MPRTAAVATSACNESLGCVQTKCGRLLRINICQNADNDRPRSPSENANAVLRNRSQITTTNDDK